MFTVNNTLPRPNIPRTIRSNEELYEELSKISMHEEVSFNSLVLQCCQYALRYYSGDDGLIGEKADE